MTKVLVITNKEDLTTDFVVNRLQQKGVPFYRLNTEDICQGLLLTVKPQLGICYVQDDILHKTVDLLEFDSIYYRRPEIKEYNDPELRSGEKAFLTSEVFYSLEGVYKILDKKYWVSPLYAIREAENKVYQLMLANQIGFATPETILTSNPVHLSAFLNNRDCIIKPVHNGRVVDGKSPEVVYTSDFKHPFDLEQVKYSPNFVQQKIHKVYDVRVTMVGSKPFAVRIESQGEDLTKTDWRRGQAILQHEPIDIPESIEKKCKLLMGILHLRYAAIDFAIDENGEYIFFEINPNGQWAWIEHLTGLPISNEIVNLLINKNV